MNQSSQHPEDKPWVGWAEVLQARLAEAQLIDPDCRCYVLMDPAVRDAVEEPEFADLAMAAGVKPQPIYWHHRHLRAEHRPRLTKLDLAANTGSELLAWSLRMAKEDTDPGSLQQGQGQRIAGWLFANSTVHLLALHLGELAIQDMPDGLPASAGRRRLLRFFDPLVWPVLWGLSDGQQRSAALGPVQQWFWLEPHGLLNSTPLHAGPSKSRDNAASSIRPIYALWLAHQWRTLLCLDGFNPSALGHGMSERVLALRPTVLTTLERLYQLGVHTQRDLQAMANLALKHHPEFDAHPRIEQLLSRRTPDQSGAEGLSALGSDDWEHIRRELFTRDALARTASSQTKIDPQHG